MLMQLECVQNITQQKEIYKPLWEQRLVACTLAMLIIVNTPVAQLLVSHDMFACCLVLVFMQKNLQFKTEKKVNEKKEKKCKSICFL